MMHSRAFVLHSHTLPLQCCCCCYCLFIQICRKFFNARIFPILFLDVIIANESEKNTRERKDTTQTEVFSNICGKIYDCRHLKRGRKVFSIWIYYTTSNDIIDICIHGPFFILFFHRSTIFTYENDKTK